MFIELFVEYCLFFLSREFFQLEGLNVNCMGIRQNKVNIRIPSHDPADLERSLFRILRFVESFEAEFSFRIIFFYFIIIFYTFNVSATSCRVED